MSAERFYQLIEQYQSDELNVAEWKEFSSILETGAYKTWIDADIRETFDKMEAHVLWDDNLKGDVWNKVKDKTVLLGTPAVAPAHRVHFLKTSWFRYAAAVVLVAGGAAVWWELSRSARNDGAVVTTVSRSEDIQPGTNRAILTVGNSRIALASNKTGINVGSTITYNDGERIADAGELLQLMTPRGGQYQAVLPDGSKVWLNAASSIRFPSKFSGDKREVEIAGEVYIEVARNSKQPFYVHTQKTTVQVLGTSFNVNAYSDEESEKMTLIEGSVRVLVNAGNSSEVLRPGQQAQVLNDELSVLNNQADVAIAWKNGLFSFNDADLRSVMRQLERWYNIKVQYEGKVSDISLKGKMYRNVNLSDVLEFLQTLGVNTRMEGKTLIVL